MEITFHRHGFHLPELDLWLDNTQDSDVTWVSHGHADHARGRHRVVIATPETARIFRIRYGGYWDPEFQLLPHGESIEFRGARLTAYPASHIVGAAQLLVEHRGERVVYTGDIKLRSPLCGRTTEIVACDRLIIESTFGLPIYRFLDRDQARARIIAFAQRCLAEDATPVFIGYALGRGQEIVHALCSAGITTGVHGAIAKLIPVYEEAGYQFPGWIPYGESKKGGPCAWVVTPDFRRLLEARGGNTRLAYVSGWAMTDNARHRTGAEELIPYSDHGDFQELLTMVEQSGAREVDVVHGFTQPFARVLCQRGLEARAPLAMAARDDEEETEA